MVPQPIEGSSYIVTASTISSTTPKSTSGLFTSIFQHFRPSGLEQRPQPSMAPSDPFSEVESVSAPSSPASSSSSDSSPSSSPISSPSQLPDNSSFASPSTSASTLRSHSHRQNSSATASSVSSRRNKESRRKSRTARRGQISDENVQDLQDTISIARSLIPGYPDTSYTIPPSEYPENSFLTVILVVVISSVTFAWSLAKFCCISSSQYLFQASSNMAHSWRSWRAGYRLRRSPTTTSASRKRHVPLHKRITRWFKGSPANPPPPIWPPRDLVLASNSNHTSNSNPFSHPNAPAGPSAASTSAPLRRGRGVRQAAVEYVPPPPPPKSMAKPPMKQWQRRRPLASSQSTSNHPSSSSSATTQGTGSSSSASRLAKIDLQVQVARGMMRSALQKFREMFQYEVPDAEEIFESPLVPEGVEQHLNSRGELQLQVDERQPTIVTHRMYWQGESEQVPEALSLAVESLLSHLTITNCNIALEDVMAVLSLCPSLQTLEVREVTASAEPIEALSSLALRAEHRPHGLQSLDLASRTPVDQLFNTVALPSLRNLSLRLYGDGGQTDYKILPLSKGSLRHLRLRGDIPPADQAFIRKAAASRWGFEFDMAPVYGGY